MNFESYLLRSGWGTSSATWSDILELGQGDEIARNYLRQDHSDKADAYLNRHGDSLRKQIDALTKSYLENLSSGLPATEYVKVVNQAVTIATALKPGAIYDPQVRRTGEFASPHFVAPDEFQESGLGSNISFGIHLVTATAVLPVGEVCKSMSLDGEGKFKKTKEFNKKKIETANLMFKDASLDPTGIRSDDNIHAEDLWFRDHYESLKKKLTEQKTANRPVTRIEMLDSASPCEKCRSNYFRPLHTYLKLNHGGIPVYVYTFRDDLTQQVGTNTSLTTAQLKQSVYLVEADGTITRVGVWSDGHPSVTDYCEFPL